MIQINFMCVGVQKAGTTTLHNILSQHPNLCLPTKKETHFFARTEKFVKGKNSYFKNFNPTKSTKYFGEIDPEYAYYSKSAKRIYEAFGKIKIIFILRNPIDRAYSHYLMTKRRGIEKNSFEEAIILEEKRTKTEENHSHFSYISRGYYSKQIEVFEKYFEKKNIKILLFEDFIKDSKNKVIEISKFIDLPNFDYKTDVLSNPNSIPKIKAIQNIIYKKHPLKSFIGKLIPSKDVKRRIAQHIEQLNLKKSKKEPLSDALRLKIYKNYYQHEIAVLENKLSISLDNWKI